MPQFKVGDHVSLVTDNRTPPQVFTVKTVEPGGKYVVTDEDGNDSNRLESDLKKAPK